MKNIGREKGYEGKTGIIKNWGKTGHAHFSHCYCLKWDRKGQNRKVEHDMT
jgi:hypothetical protein